MSEPENEENRIICESSLACPRGIACCPVTNECHCDCDSFYIDPNQTENYDDCPSRIEYFYRTIPPEHSKREIPALQNALMIGVTIGAVAIIILILAYFSWKRNHIERVHSEHAKGVLYYFLKTFHHTRHHRNAADNVTDRYHRINRRRRNFYQSTYVMALKKSAETEKRNIYTGYHLDRNPGGNRTDKKISDKEINMAVGDKKVISNKEITDKKFRNQKNSDNGLILDHGDKSDSTMRLSPISTPQNDDNITENFTDKGGIRAVFTICSLPDVHVAIAEPLDKSDNDHLETYV